MNKILTFDELSQLRNLYSNYKPMYQPKRFDFSNTKLPKRKIDHTIYEWKSNDSTEEEQVTQQIDYSKALIVYENPTHILHSLNTNEIKMEMC